MIKFIEYKTDEVLLINPPMIFKEGFRRPSISIPLGFLYVATSLEKYTNKKVILRDYIGHPLVEINANNVGDRSNVNTMLV